MLTSAQNQSLAAFVDATPLLAAMRAAGNDQGIADALSDPAGPGAGTVTSPTMSRDDFLTAILPAAAALAGKDAATQSRYDRLIGLACAATTIKPAVVQGLIGMAVNDGLLDPTYAATIGKRSGSWAEVNVGVGVSLTNGDVSYALRGAR